MWQCVLSLPRSLCRCGTLHIYKINVESVTDPITHPTDPPTDFEITGEKWVTDDDVDRSSGRIDMTHPGFIEVTEKLWWNLEELHKKDSLPRPPADEESIWDIKGGQPQTVILN